MQKVDLAGLPEHVRERWPVAVARAERKTAAATLDPAASRLAQAATRAASVRQRVVWLHRAADAWSASLAAVAACTNGCSHCCHIPVAITQVEADLIGQAARRKPVRPPRTVRVQDLLNVENADEAREAENAVRGAVGTPCPFLVNGRCSVYAARPMACRLLLNLDDDPLLCELSDGPASPVPYANGRQLQAWNLMAQPGSELADIREFFP